jgi:hypothetical protein
MNLKNFKKASKAKPRRKSAISGSKRRMLKVAKEWKPNTSSQMQEAYSSKVEWASKVIPKLKKD